MRAARRIGRALARGAFGWTEPETPRAVRHVSGERAWFELECAPVQWREEMAGRLERSPHVLPARMVRALADALRRLSDGSGDTPWLLAPHREPGRGSNPQEARLMEEEAWCWIFRRKGAGESIGVATSKVADAVGRTPDAVKKWREGWEKRDGKESVKCMLEEQKEIGASREPPPETLLDLPEIARRWQAAVDPRRAEGRRILRRPSLSRLCGVAERLMPEDGADPLRPSGEAAHVADGRSLQLRLAARRRFAWDRLLEIGVHTLVRVEVGTV